MLLPVLLPPALWFVVGAVVGVVVVAPVVFVAVLGEAAVDAVFAADV